jgi:D-sedoheptulose 7-phosphate isomerase
MGMATKKSMQKPQTDNCEIFYDRYFSAHQQVLDKTRAQLGPVFVDWARRGAEVVRAGRKILFFGNGGSAADAQHIAAELSIKFLKDRPALPGLALTTDTSALTAASNDYGYEMIFARQIMALGQKGDMAVGLSTSGKSPNVIKALQQAQQQGLITVALCGEHTADIKQFADICIPVPAKLTPHIQEMHIMLGHAFCVALEDELDLIPYKDSPWAA